MHMHMHRHTEREREREYSVLISQVHFIRFSLPQTYPKDMG